MYDEDPLQISGDFVNRLLKNEREIVITNTVSITERVWKQLSNPLKKRFKLLKYSKHVESNIYNYGGKERQIDILKSLRNIDELDGLQKPAESPECVEVIAFKGDTLFELSKHAYADVILEGFENVGGLNLLVTKNSDLCK